MRSHEPPESFAAVLKEHQEAFSDKGGEFGRSPIQQAWEHQLKRAVRLGGARNWDPEQLDEHLTAAQALLRSLSSSLNFALDRGEREDSEKKGLLYRDFDDDYFRTKGLGRCPVDKSGLDNDLEHYLSRPTLSCGAFDWIFVNAYLRYYIEALHEGVGSGAAFGTINWSYLFSGSKPAVMLVLRLVGALLGFALNWLVLPAVAAYALYSGRPGLAVAVAAVFTLLVIGRVVSIPGTIAKRRDRRKLDRAFEDMMTLKYYAGVPIWNPTDLLKSVRRFEEKYPEVYLMPLTSVLARAVDRDPHVLARDFDEEIIPANVGT